MSSPVNTVFVNHLAVEMADLGLRFVLPVLHQYSKAMFESASVVFRGEGHAAINVPYFWAIFNHDGRGPIQMERGKYLVWFKDPRDDPRLAGGYPVNPEDVQHLHLSKEEFKVLRPLMIFRRRVRGTVPTLFFDNDAGMAGFSGRADDLAHERFDEFVRRRLDEGVSERRTININL